MLTVVLYNTVLCVTRNRDMRVACINILVFSIFSWYGLNRIVKMHVEKKSELRSLLKSGDKRCKLVEPRNAKSCVWRFFNLVSCDDRIEPYACCKTCGDLLSYSGKTGTGSLLRHRCLHTTNGKFGSDIHARPLTLPRVFRAGNVVVVIATVCPSVVIYTGCFHLKQKSLSEKIAPHIHIEQNYPFYL